VAGSLAARSDWRILDTGERRRVVILVSREGHCLYDLLGRVASGELDRAGAEPPPQLPTLVRGRLALARGLRWHLENRGLMHGNKTVVF
jgi:formyltetrahydrofolate hydrolase